jgi:hypothetical protein
MLVEVRRCQNGTYRLHLQEKREGQTRNEAKSAVFCNVKPCGFSEERIVCISRVSRIGELGTTLAITGNGSTLQTNIMYFYVPYFFAA